MLRRNNSGDLISRRGQTLRARLAGRGALQYQPDPAMPPRDSPEGRRKSEDEGRCAHARRVHGVWRGGVHIHRVRVSVRVCVGGGGSKASGARQGVPQHLGDLE